jgi:hypothetical protein
MLRRHPQAQLEEMGALVQAVRKVKDWKIGNFRQFGGYRTMRNA